MPVKHHINNSSRLIITTIEGEADDLNLVGSMKDYQRDIQSNPEYADYNELLDLSNISAAKFLSAHIEQVGKIAATSDKTGIPKKLAIVVSSNLIYGFARMYEIYRDLSSKSNKEVKIFKKEQDAMIWLER